MTKWVYIMKNSWNGKKNKDKATSENDTIKADTKYREYHEKKLSVAIDSFVKKFITNPN